MKYVHKTAPNGLSVVCLHKDDGEATGVECLMTRYEPYVYDSLASLLPDGARAAEVGCFKGGSACILWHAMRRNGKALDLWCHDLFEPFHIRDDVVDVSACFDAAMSAWGVTGVHKVTGDSKETHAVHPDASLDYCFIDGDHSYEGAAADIRNFLPKLKPDAWLVVQDSHGEVAEALEAELSATPWRAMLIKPPFGHYVSLCHRDPQALEAFGNALKAVMDTVMSADTSADRK